MLSPQQIAQESLSRFARKRSLGFIIGEVDYDKAGYDVYDPKRNKIYYKVDVRINASEHPHKPTPIQLVKAMRNTIVSQRKPTPCSRHTHSYSALFSPTLRGTHSASCTLSSTRRASDTPPVESSTQPPTAPADEM